MCPQDVMFSECFQALVNLYMSPLRVDKNVHFTDGEIRTNKYLCLPQISQSVRELGTELRTCDSQPHTVTSKTVFPPTSPTVGVIEMFGQFYVELQPEWMQSIQQLVLYVVTAFQYQFKSTTCIRMTLGEERKGGRGKKADLSANGLC